MFKNLFRILIMVGIFGFMVYPVSAQYQETWDTEAYLFIGCEDTDGDATKEVVFLSDRILVIDGTTGNLEWESEKWNYIEDGADSYGGWYHPLLSPRLIDVNEDGVYEILFKGVKESRIRYILQEKGEVSLKIYNLAGQLVRILVEGKKEPGEYTVIWDGRNEKGEKVPSGSYFYRIVAGDYNSSKKLIMVR